jgi:hypothetical protein
MPVKNAHAMNEHQYEALKEKCLFWERTARFAVSPKALGQSGTNSGTHGSSYQRGTYSQQWTTGRGGKTSARSR